MRCRRAAGAHACGESTSSEDRSKRDLRVGGASQTCGSVGPGEKPSACLVAQTIRRISVLLDPPHDTMLKIFVASAAVSGRPGSETIRPSGRPCVQVRFEVTGLRMISLDKTNAAEFYEVYKVLSCRSAILQPIPT